MQRQNIIVVLENGVGRLDVYGNFKKACSDLGLPYHSLKMLKFPIMYLTYEIHKVKFN